jgi:amino-acid N-acetyltransferase
MTLGGVRPPAVAVRAATGAELSHVLGLLESAGLPVAGVPPSLTDFLVAEDHGALIGAIGLEVYGPAALLRSAVVDSAARGTGVGGMLVDRALWHAQARGVRVVYLLTTTADRYFPRFGFERIPREEVPDDVRTSVEFREACPASAVVMRKVLASS